MLVKIGSIAPRAGAPAFAFVLLCLLPVLGSCAATSCTAEMRVEEAPPREPIEEIGSHFFEGLLRRQDGEEAAALELFKTALTCHNPFVAGAAAAELLTAYLTSAAQFPAQTWRLVGAAATDSWEGAHRVLSGAQSANSTADARALLLSRSTSNAVLQAMNTWRRQRIFAGDLPPGFVFTPAEAAAVEGRVSASRSRWAEALSFFRVAINESPDLFFRYPDLLSDLGRAFEFTATGREGIDLFLEWEEIAARRSGSWRGHSLGAHVNDDNENSIRFLLLFFAGRTAHRRGAESIPFFERAFPFALEVSTAQSDATIWYILREASDQSPEAMMRHLERYVSYWHNDIGFFDVMDRLSRQLILDWRWDTMMRVFLIVQERESAITAKFAWIIGRAIEEGFIPRQQAATALGLPASDPVTPLMRVAFDSSGRSLYYRLMSANFLGETFIALPGADGAPSRLPESHAAQFLLGFFENGAERFVVPQVRALEDGLSLADVRLVSCALASVGNNIESILMFTRFTRRETFDFSQLTRRDWELWYPRYFWDLIERYSNMMGLEPALMLALTRAESAFMSEIVSHAGAIGLTQLMPATAVETADRIRREGGPDFRVPGGGVRGTNLDLNNPAVNVHIGARYLAVLNDRVGDPMLALLAYNAGTGRVRTWQNANRVALGFDLPIDFFLETVPFTETRNYGRNVTAAAEVYRILYFR